MGPLSSIRSCLFPDQQLTGKYAVTDITDTQSKAPSLPQPSVAAVVYNPIKVDLDALKAAVAATPGASEWTVQWLPTAEDDPGQGPQPLADPR